MGEEAFDYLLHLQVLLEDAFDEDVYTSLGVSKDGVILLRGSVAENFFAAQYDPTCPVEKLAEKIINRVKALSNKGNTDGKED